MRIEIIEKIVFAFAILAIVIVASLVGVFSFVIQKSSGISDEEIQANEEVEKWLNDARLIANGQTPQQSSVLLTVPVGSGPAVASAPGQPGAPAGGGDPNAPASSAGVPPAPPGQMDTYFDPNAQIPPDQQVAGIPWLRKQQGVTYMRPEPVSELLYQKYQAFDDAFAAAQEGAGEFVDGRYRVNWVNPNSHLASKVGLRDGDEIISVNGHPIGQSFSAGKALYDQLKNEKRFAVKIRRGGQETVLSFFVR